LPIFGRTVVISNPTLVKDVFSTSGDLLERPTQLGSVFGRGSTFSLNGDEHLERRRLVLPPFHGKRVGTYEHIVEEEVMREIETWPEGREFATLPAMTNITLNTMLRVVFGTEAELLEELRVLLPRAVALGSRLVPLPKLRHDLGPWSPWGRVMRYRRRIDAVIDSLSAIARADLAFEERSDVLSMLLQARDDNGEPISAPHIADEMVTLIAAGYETTASALAWTVERLRRHPRLLSRLTEEVDAGGSELRQATIWEVLRTRPVLNATMRTPTKRIRLGDWVIPEGTTLIISIQPGPIRRCKSNALRLDSVRRRSKPLHRRGAFQHADGRHSAHTSARIAFRANRCAGRTATQPRSGDYASTGRTSGGLPANGRGVE
jgi:cytochrome P450